MEEAIEAFSAEVEALQIGAKLDELTTRTFSGVTVTASHIKCVAPALHGHFLSRVWMDIACAVTTPGALWIPAHQQPRGIFLFHFTSRHFSNPKP